MLNKQGKGKIDWTDYTWNPISGCLHGCDYCYLKRIHGFDMTPAFHPERLKDLEKLKEPSRIFTGSSGDMVGEWVKEEWISAVAKVMHANPKHTFQILTKNPKGYAKWGFSDNVWLGTSVDGNRNLENIMTLKKARGIMENLLFVSFEPLLEMVVPTLDEIGWVIIGGKTGNPVFKPPREWIDVIIYEARKKKIPVFIKDNAGYPHTIKEFPFPRNPESLKK
jgi:protein gp37